MLWAWSQGDSFLGYGVSLTLFVLALRHIGNARTGVFLASAVRWCRASLDCVDRRRYSASLSGKHLQKLLKVHNIDWMAIKRSYKKQLAAPRKDRNSKHESVNRSRTRP